jgi:hypothetical protein
MTSTRLGNVTVFDELAEVPRWICWREELDANGRPTKVPYSVNGRKAKSTDPSTWATRAEAERVCEERKYDGIGIILGDGLGGVDLDSCRDPETGELTRWAQEILDGFHSYAEISPSGTGVKIYALGAPDDLPANTIPMATPPINGKPAKLETFVNARYFAVTGEILDGFPDELVDCGDTGGAWDRLTRLLAKHGNTKSERGNSQATGATEMSSTLQRALEYDPRLRKLWMDGRESFKNDNDYSRNDLALAAVLALKGFGNKDIEAAIRAYPLGQIGRRNGEKPPLTGRDADRAISRVLGLTAGAGGSADDSSPEGNDAEPPLPRYISLREALADPAAKRQPKVVVPRLAWRARVSLLAAREKLGKSTTAAVAVAQLSRHGIVLGGFCHDGTALIVSLEEHLDDTATRLEDLGADWDRVNLITPAHIGTNNPLDFIADVIAELKPDLVIIDTLAALVDLLADVPESGNAGDWTRVMARLTRIARETEAAVLVLHHGRKSDGKYRDSTAIGAGVDAVLEMTEGKADMTRKVTCHARFKTEPFSFILTGDTLELVGDVPLTQRILTYVAQNPDCSQNDVERSVQGRREDIRKALLDLIGEGAVNDHGDSHSGRRLRCAPPSGAPTFEDTPKTGDGEPPKNGVGVGRAHLGAPAGRTPSPSAPRSETPIRGFREAGAPGVKEELLAELELKPADDDADYARAERAAIQAESARPNPDGRCQGCGTSIEVTQTHCARCKYKGKGTE